MAAHRYWRVRFNAQSGGATPSAAEIQFRSTPGGAHEAGTVTVSSSWNAGSNPVSNCFDGNPATWWACNSGANSWLQIDYGLGNEKEIVELFWQARADAGTQSPGKIAVDWSDDGTNWTAFGDVGGLTWTNGQSRAIDLTETGEVRVYQLSAEVTHTDVPTAPIQVYQLSAEVTHTDPADAPIRVYAVSVEVIRHIADRYDWQFVEDSSPEFWGFSYTDATGWGFVDDSANDFFGFSMAIEPAVGVEWNPYRPDVPPDLPPEVYSYMREQAEIQREQHNLTQAGDTTFPWQMMVKLSDQREFTLGSLTRFYHEAYGLMLGRYVRFSESWTGGFHTPVGLDASLRAGEWVVTDDPSKSHPRLLLGVSVNYESNPSGRYGWVQVQGRGIVPLQLFAAERPERFDLFTWAAEPKRVTVGPGRVLGMVQSAESIGAVSPGLWSLPALSWYCDVSGVTDEYIAGVTDPVLEDHEARLEALEAFAAQPQPDYSQQFGAIDARFVTLQTQLNNESRYRSTADKSLLDGLNDLKQTVGQITDGPDFFSMNARITQLEDVTVPTVAAQGSAISGLTARVSDLEGWRFSAQSQLDNLTNAYSQLAGQFPQPTADGQVLVSTSTLNPDGNPIWSWTPTAFEAASMPFTPAGGVASEDVQAAIEELDSNKANASDLDDLITGPASATDNALVRFDGTTGKLVKNSNSGITDAGMMGVGTLTPLRALHIQTNGGPSAGPLTLLAMENIASNDGSGVVFSARGPTTGTGASNFVEYAGIAFRYVTRDHATRSSEMSVYTSEAGTEVESFRVSPTELWHRGLVDAVDDSAAASAGVVVGGFYRNGSQVMIRVT